MLIDYRVYATAYIILTLLFVMILGFKDIHQAIKHQNRVLIVTAIVATINAIDWIWS